MTSEFSKRLQRLREREKVKRHVLSELCGMDRGAIRRYERGERKPTLEATIKIADHFGVSLDYLVGLTDKPERNR